MDCKRWQIAIVSFLLGFCLPWAEVLAQLPQPDPERGSIARVVG